MRFVSALVDDQPRLAAVVDDDWLLDLAAAASRGMGSFGASFEGISADIVEFLRAGKPALDAARALIGAASGVPAGDRTGSAWLSRGSTRFAAVIPRPGKIICVGLNYREHARESGMAIPKTPIIFAAFPGAVTGHESVITWKAGSSDEVDYEAELGVVIGRTCRNVSASDAMDYVAGYTNANDVSARDIQRRDGQWTLAKSFDTFKPMGPELVTLDEIANPHSLRISCTVSGEVLQDSTTDELVFGPPALIEHLSAVATLEPGDVIITGTPSGVGMGRTPKRWLVDGDVVEIRIEGLGTLRNQVRITPA